MEEGTQQTNLQDWLVQFNPGIASLVFCRHLISLVARGEHLRRNRHADLLRRT